MNPISFLITALVVLVIGFYVCLGIAMLGDFLYRAWRPEQPCDYADRLRGDE